MVPGVLGVVVWKTRGFSGSVPEKITALPKKRVGCPAPVWSCPPPLPEVSEICSMGGASRGGHGAEVGVGARLEEGTASPPVQCGGGRTDDKTGLLLVDV